jgi:pyrroline-5-carboxylate reductase
MVHKTLGFIGGGRITRIMLEGWRKAGQIPDTVVSDTNVEVLESLRTEFPAIHIAPNDNRAPAIQDIVFLALHPAAISTVFVEISPCLRPDALLVSLAPRLTIQKLKAGLGGFQRIARVIPNAPSIIGQGYNPTVFAETLAPIEREHIVALLRLLGDCPEVPEDNLEAYAILSAMGPTYIWFQLYELQAIGKSFGLLDQDVQTGLGKMVIGAINTMYQSGLSADEVMDLVPVKPLADEESGIKAIYQQKLQSLYAKLKA